MIRRLVIAVVAAASSGGVALADTGPPTKPWDLRGAAAFSNMCLSAETGDVKGTRLFVRPKGARPQVVMQIAEGAPMPPMATVSIIDGRMISFSVTATGEGFNGVFVGDTLTLHNARLGKSPLTLRKRDETRTLSVCAAGEGRS